MFGRPFLTKFTSFAERLSGLKPERPKLLRVDEVALQLNVSKRTIYRLVSEAHFECLRIRGSIRITENSVKNYIKRQIYLFQLENGFE
jgi:excisionase family DNA binding protein